MANPKHQQVWDALKTLLGTIQSDGGTTYWYTVESVIDFPDFDSHCLNSSKDVIYTLSPLDSEVDPFTFTDTRVNAEIKLTLAKRLGTLAGTEENPFDPPDDENNRLVIMGRLIADATKKLNSDWDLGGVALRVGVVSEIRNADDTYYEGWAVAKLILRAFYVYADTSP